MFGMIVSKKNDYDTWQDFEGYSSRLSGPSNEEFKIYQVSYIEHRLYGVFCYPFFWYLNGKEFSHLKGLTK